MASITGSNTGCTSGGNGTTYEHETSNQKILLAGAMSSIFFLAFISNFTLMCIVLRNAKLRTVPNKLVVNLSVCGLLTVILNGPFVVTTLIKGWWIFPCWMCDLNGFTTTVYGFAAITTLAIISINRYQLVRLPNQAKKAWITPRRLPFVISGIWIFSCLLAAPPLLGWSRYEYVPHRAICTLLWSTDLSYTIFIFLLGVILPFIVILYSYLNIFLTVRKSYRNLKSHRSVKNDVQPNVKLNGLTRNYSRGFASETNVPISAAKSPNDKYFSKRRRSLFVPKKNKVRPKISISTIEQNSTNDAIFSFLKTVVSEQSSSGDKQGTDKSKGNSANQSTHQQVQSIAAGQLSMKERMLLLQLQRATHASHRLSPLHVSDVKTKNRDQGKAQSASQREKKKRARRKKRSQDGHKPKQNSRVSATSSDNRRECEEVFHENEGLNNHQREGGHPSQNPPKVVDLNFVENSERTANRCRSRSDTSSSPAPPSTCGGEDHAEEYTNYWNLGGTERTQPSLRQMDREITDDDSLFGPSTRDRISHISNEFYDVHLDSQDHVTDLGGKDILNPSNGESMGNDEISCKQSDISVSPSTPNQPDKLNRKTGSSMFHAEVNCINHVLNLPDGGCEEQNLDNMIKAGQQNVLDRDICENCETVTSHDKSSVVNSGNSSSGKRKWSREKSGSSKSSDCNSESILISKPTRCNLGRPVSTNANWAATFTSITQKRLFPSTRAKSSIRGGTMSNMRDELRITAILFVILSSFMMCWAPITIVNFIETVSPGDISDAMNTFSVFMMFLSSLVNPLTYGLLNRNFRKELSTLCCSRGKRPSKQDVTQTLANRFKSKFTVA